MRRIPFILLTMALLGLSGCTQPGAQPAEDDELAQLQEQVAELQQQLSERDDTIDNLATALAASSQTTEESEVGTEEESPGGIWQVTSGVYLVAVGNINGNRLVELIVEAGNEQGSILGRSTVGEVAPLLPNYGSSLEREDSLLVYNASSEPLSRLEDWPEDFTYLLPLTADELELESRSLPFLYFRLDANRPQTARGILVVRSPEDAIDGMSYLLANGVPLNEVTRFADDSGPVLKETEPGSETFDGDRLVLEGQSFTVDYPEGYEADAQQMLAWADQVMEILLPAFPDAWSTIGKAVTIYVGGDTECGSSSGGWYWGVDKPTMSFPLPSFCSAQDSYYDADWFNGNLAHEFSHVLYMRYRKDRAGAGGYDYFDAPSWFGEGVGEYFRLLVMGEDMFDRKYSWYEPEAENIITDGFADVSNVYAAGAWVLRFLDANYGLDVIVNVMKSSRATFWDALEEETGLNTGQFEERLQDWLVARQVSSDQP